VAKSSAMILGALRIALAKVKQGIEKLPLEESGGVEMSAKASSVFQLE
jgi:hypothetical protein